MPGLVMHISAPIGRLIILAALTYIQAKACLQTNDEHGLPFFQGYGSCSDCPGGPNKRIHHQHQAIIPSYRFNCCGNITEWGVDLNPDRAPRNNARKFDFILQVWRPSPTVNVSDSNYNGCFSLVNAFSVMSTVSQSEGIVRVTPSLQYQLEFQTGDVLGFYVESHGGSDHDNGVVLLDNGTHTSVLVWFASTDIIAQPSQSGSCPYSVGTNGVLNSSTHAAPVISLSVMTTSCYPNYSSRGSIAPTSLPNFTRIRGTIPKPHFTGTSYAKVPESLSNGLMIAGVMVAFFIIASIFCITVIIAVIVFIKQHNTTKQANNTGMALSNKVYCKLDLYYSDKH